MRRGTRSQPLEGGGDVRRAVRWHLTGVVIVGLGTLGFLAASLFDAPLVSILLIGLLLVCPLLMWVPFRLERGRQRSASEPEDPTERSR